GTHLRRSFDMRGETETVTERMERLRAALEDVRRSVAATSEASQRLLEEIKEASPPSPSPPPRGRGAGSGSGSRFQVAGSRFWFAVPGRDRRPKSRADL